MSDHKNPGPNTPEGRAIASRNATKHGCCAGTLILSSESLAECPANQINSTSAQPSRPVPAP